MPSPPRLLIAGVFIAIAIAAGITVFRPRSRVTPLVWITGLIFDLDVPGGDWAKRVSGAAVALVCVVMAVLALSYHTPH